MDDNTLKYIKELFDEEYIDDDNDKEYEEYTENLGKTMYVTTNVFNKELYKKILKSLCKKCVQQYPFDRNKRISLCITCIGTYKDKCLDCDSLLKYNKKPHNFYGHLMRCTTCDINHKVPNNGLCEVCSLFDLKNDSIDDFIQNVLCNDCRPTYFENCTECEMKIYFKGYVIPFKCDKCYYKKCKKCHENKNIREYKFHDDTICKECMKNLNKKKCEKCNIYKHNTEYYERTNVYCRECNDKRTDLKRCATCQMPKLYSDYYQYPDVNCRKCNDARSDLKKCQMCQLPKYLNDYYESHHIYCIKCNDKRTSTHYATQYSCHYANSSCCGEYGKCSQCSYTFCKHHFNTHTHDVACSICGSRSTKPYNRCSYHMNAAMFPGVKNIGY